jgi:hypothetical protein
LYLLVLISLAGKTIYSPPELRYRQCTTEEDYVSHVN